MIDAPDRAAAETFIAGEGFNRAGMFGEIEIKRFVDGSPEERRQIEIVANGALQMFICERIDGPDPDDIDSADREGRGEHQEATAAHVIIRGSSVSDDDSRTLGALAIIEVEYRAAADAFVAADPVFGAGGRRRTRIDQWRFGKSIV
jgi:uncharacterized protein YciI